MTAAAPSRWIISPVVDSLLFIGAPLICIAVFLPARNLFSSQDIAIFLLAFFTFGHHFPTYLRAYGDRQLFQRHRLRFLLAPPILFVTAMWFRDQGLHGLLIFVSAWDIWHVLMQHYGFMRIYDAKQGNTERLTARLDWAVSLSWYVTLIVTSPHYLYDLLRTSYQSGIPILPVDGIGLLRTVAVLFSSGLSVVYVGHHFNRWRKGLPVSWRKLVMLTIFLSATFYLYVFLRDFLVGFAVWSAFHCIQYYGIVWVYNRSRVDGQSPLTAAVRFLFRPKAGLVALYMMLILAYGSINYWTTSINSLLLQQLLLAFVFMSNALHYYYDGFIWKVRDPETQRHLKIEATPRQAAAASGASFRLKPGLAQALAAAGVVLLLLGLEVSKPFDDLAAGRSLVAAAPQVGQAHFRLAIAQSKHGLNEEAEQSYERAVELLPDSWGARNDLAGLLIADGRLDRAEGLLREAAALMIGERQQNRLVAWSALSASLQAGDRDVEGQGGGPENVFINLADVLSSKGDHAAALSELDRALEWNPQSVRGLTNRATALAQLRRYDEAVSQFESVLELDPFYSYAHFNLASLMVQFGDLARAELHFQQAARTSDPAQRRAALSALEQLRGARQR